MLTPTQLISGILLLLILFFTFKRWQKWRLDTQPFPASWQAILTTNIAIYRKLPTALKTQLHQHIKLFLRDKVFYGCNGLQITDEMRVTIAGEACLLLLNRTTNDYYQLHHILIYPTSFIPQRVQKNESGVVSANHSILLGESWNQGKVILSWQDVINGATGSSTGHNVVLHEFAHQLDQESGSANGAPLLGSQSSYQRWARVLSKEFEQLQRHSRQGFNDVIDQYGATNPAEFFAVVTETFFERPKQLRKKHPELFDELQRFYAVNPCDWQ